MDKFASNGIKLISSVGGAAISNLNVSAGTTSNDLVSLVFSNSNGLSFGLNASTITAVQSAIAALGVSNVGNTFGNTGVSTGINFVIAGSNNISVNQSTAVGGPNTIWISGGAGGGAGFTAGNSNLGNTAGDTGVVTQQLVFVGSNNITLSGSTNAGSMTISIVGATAGGGASINVSGGTTSNNLTNLVFSNSHNVSWTMNGSTLVASASVATSLTNIRISAGAGNELLSAVTFTNSNGISFGINASTITASHNGLTSQSTQFLALTLGGNTAGTTTFHATNNASLFFNGGNNITLSGNGSTITIVGPAAATGTSFNAITLGGNTAGTTTFDASNNNSIFLHGGANITLSGNGSSITVIGGAGAAAPTLSLWYNWPAAGATQNQTYNDAMMFIVPLYAGNPFPGNMTVSSMFFGFNGTISTSAGFTRSFAVGFYYITNSTQLSLAFSASTSWGSNAANANFSQSFAGHRWVTIQSSQFNNAPAFSQTQYYMVHWNRSSSGLQSFSMMAMSNIALANARSGFMSSASVSNTSNKHLPFFGAHSVSTATPMPSTLGMSDFQCNNANYQLIPLVIFNNVGSNIV